MDRLLERQRSQHPSHDVHLRASAAQITRSPPPLHDKRDFHPREDRERGAAREQGPHRGLAQEGGADACQYYPGIPQQQVRYEHDDARCVVLNDLTTFRPTTSLTFS